MDAKRNSSILVLGRQPYLSMAELESLYGASNLRLIAKKVALLKIPVEDVAFNHLGGSVKLCCVLKVLDTSNWSTIVEQMGDIISSRAAEMSAGKFRFGISVIGFNLSPAKITASGLSIKKTLTSSGRSTRLVPNKAPELSSAQVIHDRLTESNGYELVVVKDSNQTIIAQTTQEQDIASYALRDRGRPKRDTRVGMLPPKLAQIIINLATGRTRPSTDTTILDPFCGTGVLLQEAILMGYRAYGTDLDERLIGYSKQNLDWLTQKYELEPAQYRLQQADATRHNWQDPISLVATETYLGRPFTAQPSPKVLEKTIAECNTIIKKFLLNIHGQLVPGSRLCLAIPSWRASNIQFKRLPLVDQISDLGYNRVSFEHVQGKDLIYFRENQIVARELLVLIRK